MLRCGVSGKEGGGVASRVRVMIVHLIPTQKKRRPKSGHVTYPVGRDNSPCSEKIPKK